ncbi:MAG: ABC transporter permease [Acidimicrobiales bacterium]|nr:ABC transporter permease [Acidimicrobiales bacterium]
MTSTEAAPSTASSGRRRRTPPSGPATGQDRGVVGGALLVAGLGGLWIALDPAGHLPGVVKIPAVAASLAVSYRGYRTIGRAMRGPEWDAVFWLACAWLAALTLGAVFADVLPLAEHVDITRSLAEPGNARPDLFSSHPLGTNNFSLDLLSRSLYGARVSLSTAALAVVFGLAVGGLVGMTAGFLGGWFDRVVGVVTDSMLAFPAIILLVGLAAVLGTPDTATEAVLKTGVALGVVALPVIVRLARANTLVLARSEFVTASKVMGATKTRILLRELMPNVALPVLSYSLVLVAVLVVAEGSLAFLGLGLQPPQPSWGNMIAEGGLNTLTDYPHIPLVPGAFMFATVLSLNLVGERAMARWNPRESNL